MDIATLAIQVDSTGVKTATQAMDNMTSAGSKLEGVVKGIVAAWTSWKVIEYAKDAAVLAARYETLGVVMGVVGNNAGYTRAQMEAYATALQKTGISMVESRNSLAVMAQSHIDLAKATQLGRLAQDAAVVGNMNSSEAFQHMIHGIQSGQTEILRTIGLNVNFEESYKTLGEAIHKNAKDLTEQEKTTARTNAVLAKAKDLNGAYEASMETAGKQMLSMSRYADDLKTVFGALFSDAYGTVIQSINQGLQDMKKWLVENADAARNMNVMLGLAAQNFVGIVKDALGMAEGLGKVNDELTIGEILAGGLALSVAVIRDLINTVVGFVQTLWGTIEVVISGTLLAVYKIIDALVGFAPPEWLTGLWNSGTSNTASGTKKMGTSYTAGLYNAGDLTDFEAELSGKQDSARKAEHERIKAGQVARDAEELKAAAKLKEEAAKKVADAIKDQNQALEREHIILLEGEAAAYRYDLAKAGIGGHTSEVLASKRQENEALKDEQASLERIQKILDDQDAAYEALRNTLDPSTKQAKAYADAVYEISLREEDSTEKARLLKLAYDTMTPSGIAAAAAQKQLNDEMAQASKRLDDEAKRLNQKDDYQTRIGHLNDVNATGLLAPEAYAKELHKLQLESNTVWGAIAWSVENFADRGSDALANFFNGTKTGFRDMVASMLVDLEKLILKEQVVSPFLQWASTGLTSMFGGGAASDFTSTISTVNMPALATGTNYVPQDMLALIHEGEAVVPKAYNTGGQGSNITSNVTVNVTQGGGVDAQVTGDMGAAAGNAIKAVVVNTIQEMMRPGGKLNPARGGGMR